jgi:hypothetical protein
MRNETSWKKGQSGNPAGRPAAGCSLVERLEKALTRKSKGQTKADIICTMFVNLASGGDIQAIRKLFDIIQRDYEFKKNEEIELRLLEIEKRLEGLNDRAN